MKVHDAVKLVEEFGGDTTLNQVLKMVQNGRIHKCPKCNGTGIIKIKYNAYPPGLPDSGWVQKWEYKEKECDLCDGEGYTYNEYKPKMVQDGWEIVQ